MAPVASLARPRAHHEATPGSRTRSRTVSTLPSWPLDVGRHPWMEALAGLGQGPQALTPGVAG